MRYTLTVDVADVTDHDRPDPDLMGQTFVRRINLFLGLPKSNDKVKFIAGGWH